MTTFYQSRDVSGGKPRVDASLFMSPVMPRQKREANQHAALLDATRDTLHATRGQVDVVRYFLRVRRSNGICVTAGRRRTIDRQADLDRIQAYSKEEKNYYC